MQTLKNPGEIEPNADAFKEWMGQAEKIIDSTMKNAMEQLTEVGTAILGVKRLWAELRNEI
jgi:hypothetical protein